MLGKSHAWHLARAEGFRQEQDFVHAEPEYRIALEETPNDLPTQLAYADTLYHMRRLPSRRLPLTVAQKLVSDKSGDLCLKAQVHAKEGAESRPCRTSNRQSMDGKDRSTL